jgi:hypothetical protein
MENVGWTQSNGRSNRREASLDILRCSASECTTVGLRPTYASQHVHSSSKSVCFCRAYRFDDRFVPDIEPYSSRMATNTASFVCLAGVVGLATTGRPLFLRSVFTVVSGGWGYISRSIGAYVILVTECKQAFGMRMAVRCGVQVLREWHWMCRDFIYRSGRHEYKHWTIFWKRRCG